MDDNNGQAPDDDNDELVLDWDEALDNWEEPVSADSDNAAQSEQPADQAPSTTSELVDPLTLPTQPPAPTAIPTSPPVPRIVVSRPPTAPPRSAAPSSRPTTMPGGSGPPTDPGPPPEFLEDLQSQVSDPPAGPPTDPGPAPDMDATDPPTTEHPTVPPGPMGTPTAAPGGTLGTPTSVPPSTLGTPTSVPPAMPGTPTSVPPSTLGTPTSVPPSTLGTPTSVPPSTLGTPTSVPPAMPGTPTAAPSGMPGSVAGSDHQDEGGPLEDEATSPEAPRPLYRPPSAAEIEALRDQEPDEETFEEDDEDATRIAAIPREIMEQLAAGVAPGAADGEGAAERESDVGGEGSGVFKPTAGRQAGSTQPPPANLRSDAPEAYRALTEDLADDLDEEEQTQVLDFDVDDVQVESAPPPPQKPSLPPPNPSLAPPAGSLPPPLPPGATGNATPPPPGSAPSSALPPPPPAAALSTPPAAPEGTQRGDSGLPPRISSGPPAMPAAEEPDTERISDLSDLSPPDSDEHDLEDIQSEPTQRAKPASDQGAAAARRTVRGRKPRAERMPLVGTGEATQAAREELLVALAQKATGAHRAGLLVYAAELAEQRSDLDTARTRYGEARTADPEHFGALRALCRIAQRDGEIDTLCELLQAQVKLPLEPADRSHALCNLAEVQWRRGDAEAALASARQAIEVAPDSLQAMLTLARAASATRHEQAAEPLSALADRTEDPQLAAALRVLAGRSLEEAQSLEEAASVYRAALEDDSGAAGAALGLARVEVAQGHFEKAADAVGKVADLSVDDSIRDAFKRQQARLLGDAGDAPTRASEALGQVSDPVALRTRAEFAMAAGEPDHAMAALKAWSEATHGTMRALAQLSLAELLSAEGDHEASDAALASAAEADAQLPLTPVVREVLARRGGDATRLARALADGDDSGHGQIAAAAKLAADPEAVEQERQWLQQASNGDFGACARLLDQDAAAEAGDVDAALQRLSGYAERCPPAQRPGPLVAASSIARRQQDNARADEWLQQAAEAAPDLTLVLRALGRASTEPAEAAEAWGREAAATQGVRSAYAHLQRARLVPNDLDAYTALEAAHEAAPAYKPVTDALLAAARRRGDLSALAALHSEQAGRAVDAQPKVAHLVRSALVRGTEEPEAAASQLVQAAELAPGDAVVRELALRLGEALPAGLRAEILKQGLDRGPAPFRRAAGLAAAGAYEDAGDARQAADLYSAVLEQHPDDPIAEQGLERVAREAGQKDALAERRQKAAREARSEGSRVAALEGLIDLEQDDNPDGALVSAQGILDIDPTHPQSIRTVERFLMADDEIDELIDLQGRVLAATSGPLDRGARLRLLSVLKQRQDAEGRHDAMDEAMLQYGVSASGGKWLARQLLAVGRAHGRTDAMRWGSDLLAHGADQPLEVIGAAVRRARAQGRDNRPAMVQILEEAVLQDPDHPLGREALAEARLKADDTRGAAEGFEDAARVSKYPRRAARLWHRAGSLWQEQLDAPDRARDAFREAADIDITYADVHERLEGLLSGRNDVDGLIALTEAKIKAGGTAAQLCKLHRSLAKMYDKQGDKAAARAHLRDALSLMPENLDALRELAQLCRLEKEWRETAEVLIRIARLVKDPGELRTVFFQLGEIYDEHLPDPRRAEAAYRRVLKLSAKHTEALSKLADLYVREGQRDKAVEALRRLSDATSNPVHRRDVVFRLASTEEKLGDARSAENTLETLRKQVPTDAQVVRALADFYKRQGAESALGMHLDRAATDLRGALEDDPDDAALWTSMVEVQALHGRTDAARVCASAAFALGLADGEVVERVDSDGGLPGARAAVGDPMLDPLLFPKALSPAARAVFRLAGEAFGKVLPFDIRAAGGEKLARKHPLRELSRHTAQWLGVTDLEIYTTAKLPQAFVPVIDSPVTLLVGAKLLDELTELETQFLLVRAYKIATSHMSVVCRSKPEQLALVTMGLVRACMGDYLPPNVDEALLAETSTKVAKSIPRRAREELLPAAIEMGGAPDFQPARFYSHVSRAANRAGLLAVGSVPAALSALCRLAGVPFTGRPGSVAVAKVDEARELLHFAISEAHFEARQKTGADRA